MKATLVKKLTSLFLLTAVAGFAAATPAFAEVESNRLDPVIPKIDEDHNNANGFTATCVAGVAAGGILAGAFRKSPRTNQL